MDAPYTGGFSPGGYQFAVDGDFTQAWPCCAPKVSFPMKGDSIFSNNDILYLGEDGEYHTYASGEFPNLQPWSSNQRAIVLEQDFMIAAGSYRPPPLNTPYFDGWSCGWASELSNGQPIPDLSYLTFQEEISQEDVGSGIIRVRLRFACVPPTRNEIEQFTYTFPGIADGRLPFTKTVQSRVQYDYFLFDDFGIYPYSDVFPDGYVLNADTGISPDLIILESQNYYSATADAVANNNFLPQGDGLVLQDDSGPDPGTTPTASQYLGWANGISTSNGLPAEIIAEASSMRRWIGNIFERRTRFVTLQ